MIVHLQSEFQPKVSALSCLLRPVDVRDNVAN